MIVKIFKYLTISVLALMLGGLIWLFIPKFKTDFNNNPRESTQFWKLKTGSTIAYTHIQSKTDTIKSTIVYLHGGPGGYVDNLIINVFKEISKIGYDVYLYDQIGCGLSGRLKNPKEYSVQRHLDDLNEIIETINSKNITLVGQSWGAILASCYTSVHPESINRLILTSPGGIEPFNRSIFKKYESNTIKGLTNINDRVSQFNERIESNMSIKEKLWLGIAKRTANTNIMNDFKVDGILHKKSKIFVSGMVCDTANISRPTGRPGMYCSIFTNKSRKNMPIDIRAKKNLFTNPTIILKGQCDYIPWQLAYEYKEIFPNTEIKVIRNAGHAIYVENRMDYISAILNYLEKSK